MPLVTPSVTYKQLGEKKPTRILQQVLLALFVKLHACDALVPYSERVDKAISYLAPNGKTRTKPIREGKIITAIELMHLSMQKIYF